MVKYWDSAYERFKYLKAKYGFYPPRDFEDFIWQFERIEKENPEDAIEGAKRENFVLLYEDENCMKIQLLGKAKGDYQIIYIIITEGMSGKFLESDPKSKWANFLLPKVKEKVEPIKIPKVRVEYKEIQINEIYIPPNYPRRFLDPEHVFEISSSMKEIGQVDPIVVVPIDYGKNREEAEIPKEEAKKYKYILIKGLHRIEALKKINQLIVNAIIKYNSYDKECLRAFAEDRGKRSSPYEQSLIVRLYRNKGYTQEEVAKEMNSTQQWISRIEKFADFQKDWKEKDYVLTAFTTPALERLYSLRKFWLLNPKSEEGRKYEFSKERAIEDFEKGKRIIDIGDIEKYENDFDWKEKEKQFGKEAVEVVRSALESPKESQKQIQPSSQIQIEKPIEEKKTTIPMREEIKEVKKRREEKTPEEKFENNLKHANYFTYIEKVDLINNLLKEFSFEEKSKLNIPDLYRALDEIDWNFVKQATSLDKLKELYRNEIKKQIQAGRIMKKRRLKN
ncbi:MAG: ParB N-terminal domain-containing protein [Candidatus Methanomethylicaceae archaeon]